VSKQLVNIVLLESSDIVFEGLSNLFSKSKQYSKLYRAESINEIENLACTEKLDVAIVNPNQIQNKTKEFLTTKRNLHDMCWVGLVYSLFDHELLSLFDKTIHITDSPEKIIGIIEKFTDADNQHLNIGGYEQLSEREIDVLKLLVAGLSNKEIAGKLFISIHTVISHRKNITQKTGIKSQAGLTIYAISNKIVKLEDYTE